MQYRFTQMAANAMQYAADVASELSHNYIGTEHLLIGLLREEDGLASQVLAENDITEDKVMRLVEQLITSGNVEVADVIDYTPRSRRILELAGREALRFNAQAHRHRAFAHCHAQRKRLCGRTSSDDSGGKYTEIVRRYFKRHGL